jgi:pyridoxal phosphate enzyme (YggS family)
MLDAAEQIAENLARVRERIAAAAARSGRSADDVKLVGVTKYVSAEVARSLVEAGLVDLGESRPQELWRKAQSLGSESIRWHLIGHLQRNKIRRTLPLTKLIHSGDSLRLLEALSQESMALARRTDVLLEVNISGDEAKHGFTPAELPALLPSLAALANLRICGLMGMASYEGGADRARREFASLRELRDRLLADCPPEISLAELSMGMSGDYEEAIEEGATMARVGSALLEGLPA